MPGSASARLAARLLVAACIAAAAGTAFATDASSRPVAAYANQRAAVQAPAQVARATQAQRVMLGKLPATRLAQERNADADPKGVRPKIGFPREVAALRDSGAMQTLLAWEALPEGGRVAAVSIDSPEAAGLRVGLLVEALPREARLRLYAQGDRGGVHGIDGGEILDTLAHNRASGASGDAARTYWLPLVDGSEATLEIELPSGIATETVRVAVPRVSHLFLTPGQYDTELATRRAASCNLDVTCQPYLSTWIDYSKSVARADFVEDGYTYLCSGTLLADRANSFTPYFLSANHCIDSQTVASTLETTWFYRSATCNGHEVFPGKKVVTGGATLLYNSATTDTSFMRLANDAPPGAIYAGWLPALPARYTSVVGLHHPSGDLQKISLGFVSDYEACRDDPSSAVYCESASATNAQFMAVSWQQGITESGSSGSGIWVQHDDGNYYLVGALYAGSSSCYSTGSDTYGRFDLAYHAALKQWLNAGGTAEYSLTVNKNAGGTVASSPGGIDCGGDCLAVFATGSSVTLTATPAAGYSFHGWDGACSGSASSCTVSMSAARDVDAHFVRNLSKGMPLTALSGTLNSETLYALSVPAGAADLTIRTSGGSGDVDIFVRRDAIPTSTSHDCVSDGPSNTEHCLFAAPAQGSYYILLKAFSAYSDLTMTASYSTTLSAHTLTVATSGDGTVTSSPGGIDCGSDCVESFVSGSSVTLTATPAAGGSFSGWGGACGGTATTCTLAVTDSANVSAGFAGTTQATATDCLFDWVESNYPDWFAPAGTASQNLAGYYLRHYLSTQSYLGTLDGRVYYLGEFSPGTVLDLGSLSGWLAATGCD